MTILKTLPARLEFGSLNEAQVLTILSWRNHPLVRKWMFDSKEIGIENHRNFIKNSAKGVNSKYWLVEDTGVVSLTRISQEHNHAYLGIYANMDSHIPSKGSVLMNHLLSAGFLELGLHTIKLEVFESNLQAIKLYRRFGFRDEGNLRDFVIRNGHYENVLIMGLTKAEYLQGP